MDATDWDRRYADTEMVWSVTPNVFVEAECADLEPGRALDLAAGEGRNAIWLARKGWQVTAVDFSGVGLDKGRTIAGEACVRWVCADATTYTTQAPMDLVVIAYLQLPAPERRAAVRGGFETLRPGGTLLLVAHDSTNLAEGTGGPKDPAVLMTADDVLGDLDGLAFDVVRAGRVERRVADPDGHRESAGSVAYDCLVRVVRRRD